MKILNIICLLFAACFTVGHAAEKLPETMNLNGVWDMGYNQHYTNQVSVPGIHNDPTVIADQSLWYKKEITLPKGQWNRVTLELKGARFKPEVFVDGISLGAQEGGMAPLFFPLNHKNVKPGGNITLEIALASLKQIPESDASYIPVADQWRSNVSSSLWDDVVLHFHKDVRIDRIIPFINYDDQNAEIKFELDTESNPSFQVKAAVFGMDGNQILASSKYIEDSQYSITLDYKDKLKSWSPDDPNLYKLRLSVFGEKGELMDVSEMSFGIKNFEVKNKKFLFNNQPFTARGVTVVWPRWMRTDEGRELGYNTQWFYENIIKRTKDLGGNYLRFHLGLPPERFLDLCDKHGLFVQYEWSFFHGMPASEESLLLQYKNWLDLAMRHPSVALIHPYNETYGKELDTAWSALNKLVKDYPSLVMEERDVIHIHKYWWSLFENLGLYYDSYDDFPKAIMVDEFGGNYLDADGNFGGYPKVKEAFLRFLGRTQTAQERLDFQSKANVKVAEYWRRMGAAGISPFCALGSHEDGSHWFIGPLKEGNPKPVWEELTPVFSPQSVSLEIWDRNYAPGQSIELPVYLINDSDENSNFKVRVSIHNEDGTIDEDKIINSKVKGFETVVKNVGLQMPATAGQYTIKATLLHPPKKVKYPIYSAWDIHVLETIVPENITSTKIGVPKDELELKALLKEFNLHLTTVDDPEAELIVTSFSTWSKMEQNNLDTKQMLSQAIESGKSVVMLDVGDRSLGKGYPKEGNIVLGNLQGSEKLKETRSSKYDLFAGVSLHFTEVVESESHIHPAKENNSLWEHLPKDAGWLWNGYRGGLVVPAHDMEVSGLNSNAFIKQWVEKGADNTQLISKPYYAYELDGDYEFSFKKNDSKTKARLRDKVRFLMEDAPALATSLDPNGRIEIRNLHDEFKQAKSGRAVNFIPLVECGKGLTRTPAAMIQFGKNKGQLVVSQLLTSGRLADGFGKEGLYGIRTDEAAKQFVLNMISYSLEKN
jgi:hypothetical protein